MPAEYPAGYYWPTRRIDRPILRQREESISQVGVPHTSKKYQSKQMIRRVVVSLRSNMPAGLEVLVYLDGTL